MLYVGWSLAACAETPLDLVWKEGSDLPSGGGVSGHGAGGATSGGDSGGETGSDGGAASGGAPISCDEANQKYYVMRLLANDSCLQRGAPTPVGDAEGHLIELAPCTNGLEQLWTLLPQEDANAYEFRHAETGDNLDIRYASAADGTIAILFEPHPVYELYNQRFFIREEPAAGTEGELVGGPRWVAPRHVDFKCLTYVPGIEGAEVQIWTCGADQVNQRWEIEPVGCPTTQQ